MSEVWIDRSVIEVAAEAMGLTPDQAIAWYSENKDTVRKIRDYVATVKSPTPEDVEANADPSGPLDPTLVAQIGALLEAGGLLIRMPGT